MLKFMKKIQSKQGLRGWMLMTNIVIVAGSILVYELIDFITNTIISKNYDYNPISGIGMTLPMSILVYIITSAFSKNLYHYISELTDGISKIASGEFQVKLDEKNGGPLKEVYHNFNIMCDELNSIETLRNDFINEFSHEFKTPLASINGFTNLLLEGNCSPDQVKQYLTIIATESERLVSITQSQLLLSKLDAQKIILDKKKYSLDEQIRHCMIMMIKEWEKKNLDLVIDLPKITYYGNCDIMEQVWLNLLTNAIKYTPEKGEISITSRQINKEIEISISDTGIGMTAEQIDHIFTKYYRIESNSNIQGLGLGLSIVKRIIELCNGQLQVISTPGKGSTFTVILPIVNINQLKI